MEEKNDPANGSQIRGLQVVVTDAIIQTALPANSGHCMISDAVKESAKRKGWKIGKVLTDLQTIRFTKTRKGKHIRYICFTPRIGQLALLAFDQGKEPKAFSFRLTPVQVIESPVTNRPIKPRLAIGVTTTGKGVVTHKRPIKHGGMALPTTIGLRREFGLRQMGVYQAPTVATTE